MVSRIVKSNHGRERLTGVFRTMLWWSKWSFDMACAMLLASLSCVFRMIRAIRTSWRVRWRARRCAWFDADAGDGLASSRARRCIMTWSAATGTFLNRAVVKIHGFKAVGVEYFRQLCSACATAIIENRGFADRASEFKCDLRPCELGNADGGDHATCAAVE